VALRELPVQAVSKVLAAAQASQVPVAFKARRVQLALLALVAFKARVALQESPVLLAYRVQAVAPALPGLVVFKEPAARQA
jgi:hypothetical protein